MLNNRKLSEKGVDLIVSFEGEELKVYLDPIGIPTVGIGHVCLPHEKFSIGEKISQELSRKLFAYDVQRFENAVNQYVSRPLNQNQFDALVSFCFNVGATTFRKSSVLRLVNENKFVEAANFLLRYKFADGKVLPGLVRRRKAERDLFLS